MHEVYTSVNGYTEIKVILVSTKNVPSEKNKRLGSVIHRVIKYIYGPILSILSTGFILSEIFLDEIREHNNSTIAAVTYYLLAQASARPLFRRSPSFVVAPLSS